MSRSAPATGNSRGRRLLSGVAWSYGAQMVSVVAQMLYAAVTTRLVLPSLFGIYAISLIVVGLFTLISNGGVSQTVARLEEVDSRTISALQSYSVALGLAAGGLLLLTAAFWASLWGNTSATSAIRLVAVCALLAPCVGLATGLLRRQGRFRYLAVLTTVSNVLGMSIGAVFVVIFRSAESLVVSPVASQVFIFAVAVLGNRVLLLRFSSPRAAASQVSFSSKVIASNLVAYFNGNFVKMVTSHLLGVSALGVWNRAEVLTTVPLFQLQSAAIQVLYPEFRHDINSPGRAYKVWTDMLVLAASMVMPIVTVLAILAPALTSFLFGPGWGGAAALMPVLALAAGFQLVTTLLASAIEALGRFRWIWITELVLVVLQVLGAVTLYLFSSLLVAVWSVVFTQAVRHMAQLMFAVRSGYVDFGRIWRSYLRIAAFCSLLYGTFQVFNLYLLIRFGYSPVVVGAGVLIVLAIPACVYAFRQRVSAYLVVQTYFMRSRK